MAAFLVDAQLPPGLAEFLRSRGHEAWHVHELGLNAASDDAIAREAERRRCILVSKDEDFVILSDLGRLSAQVLWIRLGNTTNRILAEKAGLVLDEALAAFAAGERIVEVV